MGVGENRKNWIYREYEEHSRYKGFRTFVTFGPWDQSTTPCTQEVNFQAIGMGHRHRGRQWYQWHKVQQAELTRHTRRRHARSEVAESDSEIFVLRFRDVFSWQIFPENCYTDPVCRPLLSFLFLFPSPCSLPKIISLNLPLETAFLWILCAPLTSHWVGQG